MCAHNHSKGDTADPVDDHVTQPSCGEPQPRCSTRRSQCSLVPPRKSETPENDEVLTQAVPDSLRHGGRRYVRLWQYDHHRRDWER